MSQPIEQLVVSAALQSLVTEYFTATDALDHTRWAELFEPDGEFTSVFERGEAPFFTARGRAALATVLVNNEQFRKTFHLLGNTTFTVSGSAATGTVYCLAHHLLDDERSGQSLVMLIRYHDEYVRGADGWRFASRCAEQVWQEVHPASAGALSLDEGGRLKV
jgi:ketosteroid isomerase-like protein